MSRAVFASTGSPSSACLAAALPSVDSANSSSTRLRPLVLLAATSSRKLVFAAKRPSCVAAAVRLIEAGAVTYDNGSVATSTANAAAPLARRSPIPAPLPTLRPGSCDALVSMSPRNAAPSTSAVPMPRVPGSSAPAASSSPACTRRPGAPRTFRVWLRSPRFGAEVSGRPRALRMSRLRE